MLAHHTPWAPHIAAWVPDAIHSAHVALHSTLHTAFLPFEHCTLLEFDCAAYTSHTEHPSLLHCVIRTEHSTYCTAHSHFGGVVGRDSIRTRFCYSKNTIFRILAWRNLWKTLGWMMNSL